MSLKATAELAGITESYLSRIERNQRPVNSRSLLEAIAAALRVAPSRARRRVIPATCRTHGGCIEFTNLVVSKRDGAIELDPHVTGQCVLTLAEDGAIALRDALTEWLG
jgi:transcriptional regulator with XRE-family HTH domain